MDAVIATGGKQYRVRVGDTLDVEKLVPGEDGTVALRAVMLIDDEGGVKATPDALAGATVTASVVDQHRDAKITVFKYKNKTRYRRKTGHRQPQTRIRVDDITA